LALSIGTRIGDERSMPDSRNDRLGELELAALAGLKEDATLEQLQDWLDRLRQVLQRAKQRHLEPEDWTVLSAVLQEEMRRRMT
jgi:hypothetical protein